MQSYYEILGIKQTASAQEVRRAFRVLARRYHPDVNPGGGSGQKFREISEAYETLSDSGRRKQYDQNLGDRTRSGSRISAYEAFRKQFEEQQRASAAARYHKAKQEEQNRARAQRTVERSEEELVGFGSLRGELGRFLSYLKSAWSEAMGSNLKRAQSRKSSSEAPGKIVSMLEISVSLREAVLGARKTVEFEEPERLRKISIVIPPGVRSGSVLRMRNKKNRSEELVFIVKVAPHPYMRLEPRGLIVELPVSLEELVCGARIAVPTLDGSATIEVPAGSQNGNEVRVKEKGINIPGGGREDLFFRLAVKVPTCFQAVGISDKVKALDGYQEKAVRRDFPSNLAEGL